MRGTSLGVLIIRIMVYWGLLGGLSYFGKLPNALFSTVRGLSPDFIQLKCRLAPVNKRVEALREKAPNK